jgi:hypothetical protein
MLQSKSLRWLHDACNAFWNETYQDVLGTKASIPENEIRLV